MKEECAGYIEFTFMDEQANEFINLGGAGFLTQGETNAEWFALPAATPETATVFIADRMNAEFDIIDDKLITAETIVAKMGKPIDVLIREGRRITNQAVSQTRKRFSA